VVIKSVIRSTPQIDAVYGGRSDLSGAVGWQEDGDTYILFRRKVLLMS